MKIKMHNFKFYDLYRDGVTQSFINKFLTCKRQCKLEYIDGWTPKKEAKWFTYGKLVHHVLSKSYALARIPSTQEVLAFIAEYEKTLPQCMDSTDIQQREIIFGIAEKIIPIYFVRYADDFKDKHIFNEQTFCVMYKPNKFSKEIIPIKGRYDGGFLNNNDLWMLDTKCLSLIDDDLDQTLTLDTQVMLYLWSVKQLHPEYNIKGFIYNIVKRPGHRLTQKDGNIKNFCERVATDIIKNLDEYFIRIKIPITNEEIDSWERYWLKSVLDDIELWYENYEKFSYLNPNALITKYGHCSMFDLIVKRDTTNYYKRQSPFMELI